MTTPTETPNPTPTPEPTPPTPTPSGTTPASITLTREELDRQLGDTRKATERELKNAPEYKAALDAAKRLKDIEEAQKSELDKATERAAKAEADREAATTQLRTALIRGEFTRLAADKHLSAQQIADAFALADKSGIDVDADGTVTGVDKALDAVLKDRPYLAGGPNGQRATPNINPGGGGAAGGLSREQAIEQEKQRLMGTGRYL